MKKFLSKKMMLLPPFEPFSQLLTANGTYEVPRGCKKLTVIVIGAGAGHGGGAYLNGIAFGGGGGGAGGKAQSVFEGERLKNLKGQEISIVVGQRGADGAYMSNGLPGSESSFAKGTSEEVIGYGGGPGLSGQGAGAGGSGIGDTVTQGSSGGPGGVASSGANAPGHVIAGVGTFGGGAQNGAVYIMAE